MTSTPITDAAAGNILDANEAWEQTFDPCPCGAYVPIEIARELETRLILTLAALQDVKTRMEASDHWWIDSPNKGGFDGKMIDSAIERAKRLT